MQLCVFWPWGNQKNTHTQSIFFIEPFTNGNHQPARHEDIPALELLLPRIKVMGEKLLGTAFHTIELNRAEGRLELSLTKGVVNSHHRDMFRRFRGWIECFAVEIAVQTQSRLTA